MKYLNWPLFVLGPSALVMAASIWLQSVQLLRNWQPVPPFAHFLFAEIICTLVMGGPQIIWAFICRLRIPRLVFFGGLIAGHLFMIFAVLWYYIVLENIPKWSADSLGFSIVFGYWPMSAVPILVGAVAGFLMHRLSKGKKAPKLIHAVAR